MAISRAARLLTFACTAILAAAACTDRAAGTGQQSDRQTPADTLSQQRVERVLQAAFAQAAALSDSIDDVLRPYPLLTPAEEAELRRYSNAAQLESARQLGVRPASDAALDSLVAAGTLVALEDSTTWWVVHELTQSVALVTPAMRALIADIGQRFQQRLEALGLPPFRIVITSALRTPEHQQALRATNPNAAAGTSTHEYGTTVDIAYFAFTAPTTILPSTESELSWLRPYTERVIAYALDAAAARKSRELAAVLGHVLAEVQEEGRVMVTMERQQPVYHITVAR